MNLSGIHNMTLQGDIHVLQTCFLSILVFFKKKKTLDNGQDYEVIYLNFSRAFRRVPHERLIGKVVAKWKGGEVLH